MSARTTLVPDTEMTTMTTRQAGRGRLVAALVLSVLAIAPAGLAQERSPVREAPGVEATRQVLLAAYPELREGRVAWRVTPTEHGIVVEAHQIELPFVPLPPDASPLVSGTAVVDEQGSLQSLRAGGTLLTVVRQKALALSARRPRDLTAALKGEKAKFAPDDGDKAAALVPSGVQTVLGGDTVRGQTFRSEAPPDHFAEALTWQVELEKHDSATNVFTLVFEPIEGRLMSVVRR
jgi:hypothetical protein